MKIMELKMKKRTSKYGLLLACLLVAAGPVAAVQESTLAPPPVRFVDELNVNVATGQPVQSLDTVSIGGERGLSHNIRLFANHFDAKAEPAVPYIDRFAGNARYVKVSENSARFRLIQGIWSIQVFSNEEDRGNYLYVMRVFGPVGSQDFKLNDDGATFSPIGDTRHSLRHELRDGRSMLIWRTPEGIESVYWGASGANGLGESGGSGKRELRTVTYPNGLQLTLEEGGVTSNAGFMLKYGFPEDGEGDIRWRSVPRWIAGVNLAYEQCSAARNATCNTSSWPIAYFEWPDAAPSSFYEGEGAMNVFTVTDQNGGISQYHYETQNICRFNGIELAGISRHCQSRFQGKEQYSPRLVAVKSARSDVVDFRYSYRNDGRFESVSSGAPGLGLEVAQTYWNLSTKEGLLRGVVHRDRTGGASVTWPNNLIEYSRGGAGVTVRMPTYQPGVIHHVISTKQGNFTLERTARNFVIRHSLGLQKDYSYDSRGNLETVLVGGVAMNQAEYLTSCTESNFKYCNKPKWIKDAEGNQTDYTYHAQSGQVKTVTKPEVTVNGKSIRPKTVYNYDELYAYYKKGSDTVEQADTPIWLLTSEHTCRTSRTTATGCEGGDLDRVKTEYYYGPQDGSPNNLFLRGMSITAEGNSRALESRVTCYQYDKYGNQIAETRPKGTASLTSCP